MQHWQITKRKSKSWLGNRGNVDAESSANKFGLVWRSDGRDDRDFLSKSGIGVRLDVTPGNFWRAGILLYRLFHLGVFFGLKTKFLISAG
jgi:hypothetical protein